MYPCCCLTSASATPYSAARLAARTTFAVSPSSAPETVSEEIQPGGVDPAPGLDDEGHEAVLVTVLRRYVHVYVLEYHIYCYSYTLVHVYTRVRISDKPKNTTAHNSTTDMNHCCLRLEV
jgi:hypothetical protein